jgi:hypothetical protein
MHEALARRSAKGGLPAEVWHSGANHLGVGLVDAGASSDPAAATDPTGATAATHTAGTGEATRSARSSIAADAGSSRPPAADGAAAAGSTPAATTARWWRDSVVRAGGRQHDQSNHTEQSKHLHLIRGYQTRP